MEKFAITRENRLAATSHQHRTKVDHLQANPLDQIRTQGVALKPVKPTTANKPAVSAPQNDPLAGIWAGANFKHVEAKPKE